LCWSLPLLKDRASRRLPSWTFADVALGLVVIGFVWLQDWPFLLSLWFLSLTLGSRVAPDEFVRIVEESGHFSFDPMPALYVCWICRSAPMLLRAMRWLSPFPNAAVVIFVLAYLSAMPVINSNADYLPAASGQAFRLRPLALSPRPQGSRWQGFWHRGCRGVPQALPTEMLHELVVCCFIALGFFFAAFVLLRPGSY